MGVVLSPFWGVFAVICVWIVLHCVVTYYFLKLFLGRRWSCGVGHGCAGNGRPGKYAVYVLAIAGFKDFCKTSCSYCWLDWRNSASILWQRYVRMAVFCRNNGVATVMIFVAVNLKNAVEFLECAETYSAMQLKKSCLQFICVNASCFLESR